jgi:hypothetical protein
MAEVVTFVSNTDKPVIPGSRTALKVIVWLLGLPAAGAAAYVAFMNVGFLAGGAATPLGQAAGTVGGIVAAAGLSMLIVAIGICWKDMRPVALMAAGLFGLCLVIALSAMGSFTWVSSQPMRAIEKPAPRFDREPRRLTTIENAIRNFLSEPREYQGKGDWTIVAPGLEILERTSDCQSFHFAWESHACERWHDLQAEKAAREKIDGGGRGAGSDEITIPGSGVIITAQAMKIGHYMSAWWSHLIIVAFASVGLAIVFGCAHELTKVPVPGAPTPAAATSPDNLIQKTFDAWAEQCLQPAAGVTVSADLLYRHHRAFADWTKGRAHAGVETFGAAMSAPLRKLGAVRTEIGKNRDTAYTGLEIRTDGLSGQLLGQIGTTAGVTP